MIDLKIDYDKAVPNPGDIVLEERDLVLTTDPTQRFTERLNLWLGDWFLDEGAGVPWLQEVLGRRPEKRMIEAVIVAALEEDPEVEFIDDFTLEFSPLTRSGVARFTVQTKEGTRSMEIEIG